MHIMRLRCFGKLKHTEGTAAAAANLKRDRQQGRVIIRRDAMVAVSALPLKSFKANSVEWHRTPSPSCKSSFGNARGAKLARAHITRECAMITQRKLRRTRH